MTFWFIEDIRGILTGLVSQADRRDDDAYKCGYMAALYDVALSLGVTSNQDAGGKYTCANQQSERL